MSSEYLSGLTSLYKPEVGEMFSRIGLPEIGIIFVLALIVFGPSKLPEIGRAFGRSIREFRDASHELTKSLSEVEEKTQ